MSETGATGRGVRIVAAEAGLEEAAARLRAGRLVAFPTETVYGLGANALDATAVRAIFTAKGRPASNPLIVHTATAADAAALSGAWPTAAATLAAQFWPGPLTLVVPKSAAVPEIVTAGGGTVGLRVPANAIARALIQRSGVPVAAPSANRSEEVSPTTAQHVADSLRGHVDDLLILDAGPCPVGLESTVVDVTTAPPTILRPGMITAADLESALAGPVAARPAPPGGVPARSPGQMLRHYAPRAAVVLTDTPLAEVRPGDGLLGWRIAELPSGAFGSDAVRLIAMPSDPKRYAARLYSALRELDGLGVQRIVVETPPDDPAGRLGWAAVHDRLRRAAAPGNRAS